VTKPWQRIHQNWQGQDQMRRLPILQIEL